MESNASRPYMPGYGIVGASEGTGLLPWSWAEERLTASHDYWLATVWPDGRPHVMPVWGVWAEDSLWFSASAGSRKTRNIEQDPRTVATTDDALNPVVVEGHTYWIHDPVAISAFTDHVNAKYATDYSVDFFSGNACLQLLPSWIFGLTEGDFTGSPTRWTVEVSR
jgi:hypothetical protein